MIIPPRPINEIFVREGYLPGKYLNVQGIGISWKIVCVRGLDRTSWKMNIIYQYNRIYICSKSIEAPGKLSLNLNFLVL